MSSEEEILSKHGSIGVGKGWILPEIAVHCNVDARPGYQTKKAHEYAEDQHVLRAKVEALAELLRKSNACIAYTGAGLSTSAGIDDYATKSQESLATRAHLTSPLLAEPTRSHFVLTHLHRIGILKRWINQNHDGLPQKAGYPQNAINEIHGAWFDPSNPVVPMDGELRADLFQDVLDWEEKADLCLALGSSMCGLNADRLAVTTAKKARKGKALGTVIIALQETQYDSICSLRIFCTLDKVLMMLAEEMGFVDQIPEEPLSIQPDASQGEIEPDVFQVPYDSDGKLMKDGTTLLDLREDAKIKLTCGPHAGCEVRLILRMHKDIIDYAS